METRYIFIGDIHGCFEELVHLLDLLSPSINDRVISLGDFLDRGPFALECIDYWREKDYMAVVGNHDDRIVQWSRGQNVPYAEGFEKTRKQFQKRPDLIRYIADLPFVVYFEEIDTAAVHAALDVNNQSLEVDKEIALRGRFVRPLTNNSIEYLGLGKEKKSDNLWVDYWRSNTKVFYGHTPTSDSRPFCKNNTTGLDTGCAYGQRLTAAIATQSGSVEYVSVPAKRKYWEKAKKEEIVII